jgi:excinuclease ABC subunit A
MAAAKKNLPFQYPDERGKIVTRTHKFEGILPNLERRYKETESVAVREELAKYICRTKAARIAAATA